MKQTKNKSKVVAVEMTRYNVPIYRERRGKDYAFYGENNLYPLELLDLFNQSPVHNAIITGKVNYIVGRGLTVTDDTVKEDVRALIQDAIDNPNPYETLNDILDKIAVDLEVYNGFALEIIRNKNGKGVEIYHGDWTKYRQSVDNENMVLFSDQWERQQKGDDQKRYAERNPEYIEIPKFDPSQNQPKSIYYYVHYRPNLKYYPLPEYVGALAPIESSVEICNFDLNAIKNGFSGGTLINLNNGYPATDEEAIDITNNFREAYTGSTNANQFLTNFADDKDHAATIENINGNDLPERYKQLEERVIQNIFIGHKVVSPMLFGVKTQGQLGGRTEMVEAYELFKESYIVRRQRILLNCMNNIFEFKGLPRVLGIEELKPLAEKLPLTDAMIESVISQDIVKEELSERFGIGFTERNVEEVSMSRVALEGEIVDGYFDSLGEDMSLFEEVYNFPVHAENEVRFEIQSVDDLGHLNMEEVTQAEVARVLRDNPDTDVETLAQVFGFSVLKMALIIGAMEAKKLISRMGSLYRSTREGNQYAALLPDELRKLEIRYKYSLRPDARPTVNGSRNFCQRLMASQKYWTREEIEGLHNNMTRSFIKDIDDVWKYRGGWYRAPGQDVSVPFCRHRWEQVVLRRR